MLPMQLGDVPDTFADVSDLTAQFDYRPKTKIKEGVKDLSHGIKAISMCSSRLRRLSKYKS